jgi:hypothetical protein
LTSWFQWINKKSKQSQAPAVVKRLMTDAEKHQMEKERLQREKMELEERKAQELANLNKEKIMSQRRPRSTIEFLSDQALHEHKKLAGLQNALIKKEQQTKDEEKKFGFKPVPDKKSALIA